jgi:hypothetical protein
MVPVVAPLVVAHLVVAPAWAPVVPPLVVAPVVPPLVAPAMVVGSTSATSVASPVAWDGSELP